MLQKKSFLLVMVCIFMFLAVSNEILAKDVEVKDLHLKLPFDSGTTWKTSCIYDDPDPDCCTHAKNGCSGNPNKDRYALDFNHYNEDNEPDDLGMSIRAAASGFAEVHTGTTGYGNYVLIHHIGGYVTRYAHLDRITVKNKTWIGRGKEVGKCGGSGGYSPHLHFALYKSDNKNGFIPVKPQPMDGYSDLSESGEKYTSSNKPTPPFRRIFDKSGIYNFPRSIVNIGWFPSEGSCGDAWYVTFNGESVCSTDPEQLCQDAYDDLLSIDSDRYSSDGWYKLFFGDVDDIDYSDDVFQCIAR